jgi:hypothetical protein
VEERRSEVARLIQSIEAEYHAAQQGLIGLAQGTARHQFITARMEKGAERLLKLIAEGKHEEVQAMMETPAWGLAGLADEGSADHTTMPLYQIDEQE